MSLPVAVVIPAHNAAAYLDMALRSVLDQTLRPAEIVVVDDGSTDDTHAVSERLAVRCVRQAQSGPAAARNRGVAETTAPLVAFLDADDWFAPSKLERQVERLEELGAAAICTDAWIVTGDRVTRSRNEGAPVAAAITMERLLRGNPVVCSTMLVRREALSQAGGFDPDPVLVATEDYDLWLRLARREPIAYLQDPLAFYRSHAGSLSANSRFVQGVDRIMQKVMADYGDEAHFRQLVAARRAAVRRDLAWDLLGQGRRAECRTVLREARALSGPNWGGLRMWLRSFLPAGSSAS
jgi:glycosyltransferase involved in cell wall biosynthesis